MTAMKRTILYPLIALGLSAAIPAVALAKDENRKPQETSANGVAQCKQAVRSMSESAPARRGECLRPRRILM
jgi:hypothetical protein